MKTGAWVLGLILFFVAVYAAAGPYLTVSRIKDGIVEQDSEKLSDNIEFPTLRQNLKDQFNSAMFNNISPELKGNPFAALAAGFASNMVDGMVEIFVTPSSLAGIMEGRESPISKAKRPGKAPSGSGKTTPGSATTRRPKKEDLFKNADFSYESMSRFSIRVPTDNGTETKFVLERKGLSWKLANIIIPLGNKRDRL